MTSQDVDQQQRALNCRKRGNSTMSFKWLAVLLLIAPAIALAEPRYVPKDGVTQIKVEFIGEVDKTCILDTDEEELACVDNPAVDPACLGRNEETNEVRPCYFIAVQAPLDMDIVIFAVNHKLGLVSGLSNSATILGPFTSRILQ